MPSRLNVIEKRVKRKMQQWRRDAFDMAGIALKVLYGDKDPWSWLGYFPSYRDSSISIGQGTVSNHTGLLQRALCIDASGVRVLTVHQYRDGRPSEVNMYIPGFWEVHLYSLYNQLLAGTPTQIKKS